MSDLREWLDRLYAQSPGYIAITAFSGGRPRRTMWKATTDLDAAEKIIRVNSKKADLYVSVGTHEAPQERGKGGEKSVLSIPGFWADLDIGEAGHKPASLPNPASESEALSIVEGLPEPSMLLHSGGGLQAFWLFDQPWVFNEPIDKTAAKQASQEWHNLLEQKGKQLNYHVDKIHNLDRILRVPETFNLKEGNSRPVSVRWADKPSIPTIELTSLGIPDAGYNDSGTPSIEDDFPLTWDEIFTPHGYDKCGENLYARPGKKCSEGHSIAVDPFGIPVAVNFSASDEALPTGQGHKLTKLKVWAALNYGGDIKAAKTALKKMVKSGPEDWERVAARFSQARIDWEKLWSEIDPEPDWLVEPLIERGRQIAVYSEAKAGKSLLLFEIALALATGRPVLGRPDRKVISIVYIDQENSKPDIRERAVKMGYEGEIPVNLHYYSFPSLAFLDTEQGGQELYALCKYHAADLTIVDTLSRVVEGDENENDTYHDFYKYTGVKLKADGITLVRLDHSGKDLSKGMRGASSKTTDVDEVWQLRAEGDLVSLTRTHTRSAHGEGYIHLTRVENPLRHVPIDGQQDTADEQANWLMLDYPTKGYDASLTMLWHKHRTESEFNSFTKEHIRIAQKRRRNRGQ